MPNNFVSSLSLMKKNSFACRRAYFCGICGTAMGQVALLLRQQGWEVAGSDDNAYPPMSHVLEAAGIKVDRGWSPDVLQVWSSGGNGIFVVGNALSRGNPQVEWLWGQPGLAVFSLPEVISLLLLHQRRRLVVAGTHGKTTTAAAAAWLLQEGGHNPGYLIGGVPRDLAAGAAAGQPSGPFVIEGDEYDSAFFDKRSKFVHYRPDVLLLNNLEFDHADIFFDLADVERSFRSLVHVVSPGGTILYNGDDPSLRKMFPVEHATCRSFGTGEENHFRLKIGEKEKAVSILEQNGTVAAELQSRLWGEFNLRNLAGAWLACRLLLPSIDHPVEILSRFSGVKRRQEILSEGEDWVVFEDFAHHPTAIRQTLKGLRQRYPGHKIIAAVEPRSNSMRRKVFENALMDSLRDADVVVFAPVHRFQQLGADMAFDPENLRTALEQAGKDFRCPKDMNSVEAELRCIMKDRQVPVVICLFSNGAFGGLPERLRSLKLK